MTTTTTARLAALALLALSACGKPLLYAEVEIPRATVTLTQQSFPATTNPSPVNVCPPEVVVAPGNTCLQQTFGFDLGNDFKDLTKDSAEIELRLTQLGISLAPTDPLGSFASVEEVVVGVDGTAQGLPVTEIASYRRSPSDPSPTTILVGGRSNVDIGSYLTGGSQLIIFARLQFNQDIPGFTADVVADFYAKVLVDYGKAAGIF